MEFKTLRNIENSFRQIRLYAIVFAVLCIGVVGYAVWRSYHFAKSNAKKSMYWITVNPDACLVAGCEH
jgi:multidrug resistance efflux pump